MASDPVKMPRDNTSIHEPGDGWSAGPPPQDGAEYRTAAGPRRGRAQWDAASSTWSVSWDGEPPSYRKTWPGLALWYTDTDTDTDTTPILAPLVSYSEYRDGLRVTFQPPGDADPIVLDLAGYKHSIPEDVATHVFIHHPNEYRVHDGDVFALELLPQPEATANPWQDCEPDKGRPVRVRAETQAGVMFGDLEWCDTAWHVSWDDGKNSGFLAGGWPDGWQWRSPSDDTDTDTDTDNPPNIPDGFEPMPDGGYVRADGGELWQTVVGVDLWAWHCDHPEGQSTAEFASPADAVAALDAFDERKEAGWSLRLTAPCGGYVLLGGRLPHQWSAEYAEGEPGVVHLHWPVGKRERLELTPAPLSNIALPVTVEQGDGLDVPGPPDGWTPAPDSDPLGRQWIPIDVGGQRVARRGRHIDRSKATAISIPYPPASLLATAGKARAEAKSRRAHAEAAVDLAALELTTAARLAIEADAAYVEALDAAKLAVEQDAAPEAEVS